MHDIKYFILNKNNQTIQGGQKKISEEANYQKYYKKTLFFKIQGVRAPRFYLVRPCFYPKIELEKKHFFRLNRIKLTCPFQYP
jgi:hypothetical protein